jgi:hypothetical protein
MANATDPTRNLRWAAIGFALIVGWTFIVIANHFHATAPVVFVCLGYLAAVAVVVNLWRIGAMAVAPEQAGEEAWERPLGPRDDLEKEKRTLLKAIKEAEFDLEMGKLSKVDADQMIATYRARAIAVIKELDRMDPRVAPDDDAYRGVMLTRRERIEREVKARLALQSEKGKRKKKGKAAKPAKAEAKAEAKPEAKPETEPEETPDEKADAKETA